MAAAADDAAAGPPNSTLRRRNSIDIPPTLTLHKNPSSSSSSYTTTTSLSSSTTSSSASSADYELVSLKPASYTSLRDILPTTGTFVQSPKPPSFSGSEISIRNRLVKQAAWAYLQPMSGASGADGSTVFHRVWSRFSDAFVRVITRIFDCLFGL